MNKIVDSLFLVAARFCILSLGGLSELMFKKYFFTDLTECSESSFFFLFSSKRKFS